MPVWFLDQFFGLILEVVPVAERVEEHSIRIDTASLTLRPPGRTYPIVEEGAFSNSQWDVITTALIGVSQENPRYEWSSSLFYTTIPDHADQYRWYEVAFFTNPLSSNEREFEPFHLCNDIDLAEAALGPGIMGIQVAYGPVPIDGVDVTAFHERWVARFSQAVKGTLEKPRRLPLTTP